MVAKSYQGLKQLSEPFDKGGKQYITIQLKSGKPKDVRYYTEQEYNKLYPTITTSSSIMKGQKFALGFQNGYITIFTNGMNMMDDWFKASICRYARCWGWYVPSTMEIPSDLPPGVSPVRLNWEEVAENEDRILPDNKLIPIIQKKMAKENNIDIQINDKITCKATVILNERKENHYGYFYHHIFIDDKGQQYSWDTKSQNWEEGKELILKGTVKGINGNCIQLIRCKEA